MDFEEDSQETLYCWQSNWDFFFDSFESSWMNYITQYTCMTISSYCVLHCFLPVATNCESEWWYTRLTRFVSGWVVSNQWQVFFGRRQESRRCVLQVPSAYNQLIVVCRWAARLLAYSCIASLPSHSQLYWATRFMSQCFFQMRFRRCSSHSVWNAFCAVSYFLYLYDAASDYGFALGRSTFDSIHYMV